MFRFRRLAGKAMLALLAVLPASGLSVSRSAMAQQPATIEIGTSKYAGEFKVPLNKSQILRLDRPFKDLYIGNSDVADVLALTDHMVYVLGKAMGSTSLTIYGPDKQLLAVLDLVVTHDVEGLKRRLHELLPDETVEVRAANDSVVVAGVMSSAGKVKQVLAVAERFAPAKVTNFLTVKGSQQVMLAVRFAEVKRSDIKELGFKEKINFYSGAHRFSLLTGGFFTGAASTTAFGSLGASLNRGADNIDAFLDALEKDGVVKTLAEPNLITMSGDTASFLAGGEFPIPVAQNTVTGSTSITIEFKQFGVGLAFTPTVLDEDRINLVVAPEVSAIDAASGIKVNNLEIPGLTTRRAKTTVELGDGQSFAIAGLLQNDFTDNISQYPFLGNLPILGALFRSSDYTQKETELVIIVTTYLVKPARPGDLKLPTDNFVPPSDEQLFLKGMKEAPESGAPGAGQGGLDGKVGHIIR